MFKNRRIDHARTCCNKVLHSIINFERLKTSLRLKIADRLKVELIMLKKLQNVSLDLVAFVIVLFKTF